MDAREIGRLLRERREALGLTLRDVQAATKIRLRYLEAIEAGETDVLPAPVYARGFVRTYANYLGLDGFELAQAYRAATEPRPEQALPPAPPERPAGPPAEPRARRPLRRLPRRLGILLLAAAVAGTLAYAATLLRQQGVPASPPPAGGPAPVAPPPAPAEPAAPGEQPAGGAGPAPAPAEPPAVQVSTDASGRIVYRVPAGPLEVTFALTGRCWLRVRADGALAFEGTLPPGERRSFRAERELVVLAGNPGALDVAVNGRPLGVPARAGPRTLVFLVEAP